jgi:hypothetical protein
MRAVTTEVIQAPLYYTVTWIGSQLAPTPLGEGGRQVAPFPAYVPVLGDR